MDIINNYQILDKSIRRPRKTSHGKGSYAASHWKIRCLTCGTEKIVTPWQAANRGCKVGPCHVNYKDLSGRTFGRLTVLKYVRIKSSGTRHWAWLCQCKCGRTCLKMPHALLYSGVTECGSCARKTNGERRRIPDSGANWNRVLKEYRRSARLRGLSFDLSEEDIKRICSEACIYCGVSPTSDCYGLVRNGIDRKNNSLGYTKDNCFPTCSECNRYKGKGSEEDFLNHVIKICAFQKKVEN